MFSKVSSQDSNSNISVFTYTDSSILQTEIEPTSKPAIIRGCPLGSCTSLWNTEYLSQKLTGTTKPVHVTTEANMSFTNKNFTYQNLDLGELIHRASTPRGSGSGCDTLFYLRAINDENPRTKPAKFEDDFPSISCDFSPPELVSPEKLFSSVLRISSGGVRVWTHYDVMDNIYCQVLGHKQAILWPPSEADKLYLNGDKSKVTDIDNVDLEQFPLFPHAKRYSANLEPGDILYIPALWFHNMLALDFGVAVNVFWKELPGNLYDTKDPYGNKDHLPAAKAQRMMDNVIRQLNDLPPEYKDFYARKLIDRIKDKCFLKTDC